MQGMCEDPLGQSTIGLIYVNPGGPVNAPSDPVASVRIPLIANDPAVKLRGMCSLHSPVSALAHCICVHSIM